MTPHSLDVRLIVSDGIQLVKSALATLIGVSSLALSACGGPLVVSEYGSRYSPLGPPNMLEPSLAPHSGVDFGGQFGDPVIAPADGEVTEVSYHPQTCGHTLKIRHPAFDRYTIYCHFQDIVVRQGEQVKRGQRIGSLGDSGNAAGCRAVRPCPIVHVELSVSPFGSLVAVPGRNFDIMRFSAGCFDPAKTYSADRFTYPVPCKD